MLTLLILVSGLFIFLSYASRKNSDEPASGIRVSLLYALLTMSVLVFLSTEVLSLFNAITKSGIAITWGIIFCASVVAWIRKGRNFPTPAWPGQFMALDVWLAVSIAGVSGITLMTSLLASPNNWDSMTYHLARVMQWIQHHNVAHYPTQIDRQLTQPPLSEYFMLHIKLLSSYDPYSNLVQWVFTGGGMLVASLVARELGGQRTAQLWAAFFCATIPMGILQSNSTQNDAVAGFFVLAALYFALKCFQAGFLLTDAFGFYLCCGLAVATKGTSFIFLLPVSLWFALKGVRTLKARAIPSFALGLLIVAVFFCPQAARNYETFHNPLGKTYSLGNETHGLAPMLSNAAKNTAMHLRTPIPRLNGLLTDATWKFSTMIGIEPHSPKYNWSVSPAFEVGLLNAGEDYTGNLLHVLLFPLAVLILIFNKDLRSHILLREFLLVLIVMFLAFSFILKWQVWHTRLHLPMFMAAAVFLGLIAHTCHQAVQWVASTVVMLFAGIFLFLNQSRPILLDENLFNIPQYTQYFVNKPEIEAPCVEVSRLIHEKGVHRIGVILKEDSWEYPFRVLNADVSDFQLCHLMPENESSAYELREPFQSFQPEALIVDRFRPDTSGVFSYKNVSYSKIYAAPPYSFYVRLPIP